MKWLIIIWASSSFAFWVIFHAFLYLLIFSKINFFEKNLSGKLSECQTVWILPDILLGLIWVQTVCKGYQQMTLVGYELNAHADISREVSNLNFGLGLHLHPYFVYATSQGSGQSLHMCRLAWVFIARQCDKYCRFENVARILFSIIALKDILVMWKFRD